MNAKRAIIKYFTLPDEMRRREKLDWFAAQRFQDIAFETITPDEKGNWLNLTDNDFDTLLPLANKATKAAKSPAQEQAVFKLFASSIKTNRDEWVYDFNQDDLSKKISFFCDIYTNSIADASYENKSAIAWDRELENYRRRHIEKSLETVKIRKSMFRPFVSKYHYFDRHFNGMFYQWGNLTNFNNDNIFISVNKENNTKGLFCLATNRIIDLHATGDSQCLPMYHFNEKGERIINITDWGLTQFRERYEGVENMEFSDERERVDFYSKTNGFKIKKEDIFHYTYAVLHNPAYRKKYELNLKREFPRLPFYEDFHKWAARGKALMDLHINYETVEPYNLIEHQYEVKAEAKRQKEIFTKVEEPEAMYARVPKVKVKLKADKAAGVIDIDELTFLTGVPAEAWEYKLGNRSALEWVLDQYKEKKPTDPTIAEKFNTYRFADYKGHVIDLLKRVCRVSVETVKIVNEMKD